MEYVVAVLVGLGLAEVATLITTIYLHRVLSHKSIRLHPALTMFIVGAANTGEASKQNKPAVIKLFQDISVSPPS